MNKPIIVIVFIALALIFGAVFVLPKYQELDLLWQRIEKEEEELTKREEYVQYLRDTTEKLKNYQDQLAKIDSALPLDPDLPALFDFIQKAASQSGLYLKSISHSAAEASSEIEETKESTVTLQLSGSYSSLKEFLSNYLEITSRLIETTSISFSSDPEEGPREFSLGIKIYSFTSGE